MERVSDTTLKHEMRQLESRLGTLRERIRVGKDISAQSMERQIQTLEDQFELFKTQLKKKEVESKQAYSELSEGTKKAWDELWLGVHKAYKKIH